MKLNMPGGAGPAGDSPPSPQRDGDAAPPSPKRRRLMAGSASLDALKRDDAVNTGTAQPPHSERPRQALPGTATPMRGSPATFSPALQARFGLEIEVPSVDVSTGTGGSALRRGIVLLDRPHWKLECDGNGAGGHDLEFVTEPLGSQQELRTAIREITSLTEAIRAQAIAGDMTVKLKDVASDASVDAILKLNDPHLPGRLQATYGVGLDHLGLLVDELLPPKQAADIHASSQAVAAFYAARTGSPLPPRALGFVQFINMYIARAQAKLPANGTVHIFFRMMARSDFCSVFSKLLSPAESEAVRALLLRHPDSPAQVPMLMEALHMSDPDRLLFAKPYCLADCNPDHRRAGPSIKDWLSSIVEGRQEGPLHKDLLSPPDGYRLHTGDLSTDYGMGAMGVDEHNGLILFEIRGAPYRPQHVSMNGQLARAAEHEFARAGRHNAALETARPWPLASAKYRALAEADDAYSGLRNAARTLEARLGTLDASSWKYAGRYLESCVTKLAKARETIAVRPGSPWVAPLTRSMEALESAAHEVLQTGRDGRMDDLAATLDRLKAQLEHYEDALWKAGARRT